MSFFFYCASCKWKRYRLFQYSNYHQVLPERLKQNCWYWQQISCYAPVNMNLVVVYGWLMLYCMVNYDAVLYGWLWCCIVWLTDAVLYGWLWCCIVWLTMMLYCMVDCDVVLYGWLWCCIVWLIVILYWIVDSDAVLYGWLCCIVWMTMLLHCIVNTGSACILMTLEPKV